ncbi:aminopeptidase P family protein [Glutamicibacter protophormiae]|uniref:Xaa-Pro aminopeptidase n=1 Tax=Glutamicibacter protophormiae TaxID=37930 RepID=A0ABS4XUK8_GLUPR|nr:aminopeptidase P family protein [Glutamicibacter protophormiae]MBP2400208.1 Xaa-Pro aminopeptidase [Glutamicibacter protophormiae]
MTNQVSSPSGSDQPLEDRVNNRSQRPTSESFKQFMAANWAADTSQLPDADPSAGYAAARRAKLSAAYPGERLVIPAGPLKVRSNDTDYRFRPHSAFAHLTGLGVDHEPDAVLIMEPTDDGAGDNGSNHAATLYFAPMAGRDSSDFYLDSRSGEFWVGPRPTLSTMSARTGMPTDSLEQLELAITKNSGPQAMGGIRIRLVRQVDLNVEALVDTSRINTSQDLEASDALDNELAEFLSELRLVKDEYEIAELRKSVAATINGFEDVVRSLDAAIAHDRGERIVEGSFFARARLEGNDLGYDTIAACGNNATILHWIRNNGAVNEGEVLLLDAGVEADSLYTADITRSLPVSGKYTEVQRRVYEAVLDAADAAFAAVKPGLKFRDLHQIATRVLAERLSEWGILPVSVEEAMSPEGQQHRRWMPHGTSHHLGLDVHDCAQARAELYLDAELEEGMVFTIEPGLYFKNEDLAIPQEYRGIGVRIEDDILVTATGGESLSAALPRTADDVEAWMAKLRS